MKCPLQTQVKQQKGRAQTENSNFQRSGTVEVVKASQPSFTRFPVDNT